MGYWKYNIVANAYAQYAHKFGVHDIDIMGGAEQSHYHRTGTGQYGQGFDYYTNKPYNAKARKETEWATHNSLVSYFGRLNYNLLDRYHVVIFGKHFINLFSHSFHLASLFLFRTRR